jgi:YbbR domain-containing protein
MRWLIRNWHLKLGALALATVLYTGLVFSGSFNDQTFPAVPIAAIHQPNDTYVLTQELGTVDVHYRFATDSPNRVTIGSFAVTIDLAQYKMSLAPQAQSLPVTVRPLINAVTVLDYAPTSVSVAIDRLGVRTVRVVVDRGEVPAGLEIGTSTVSAQEVTATGPESLLQRVDRAVARVHIDQSGIDVHNQVELVPVDIDGRLVPSVELTPLAVNVDIDVRTVETSKTVPVRPVLSGAPATGFEVGEVTVNPAAVTLRGAPDVLSGITEVLTSPISLANARAQVTVTAVLVLPTGTRLSDTSASRPTVVIKISEEIGTRTFLVGLLCTGQPSGSACLPQLSQVAVTLRGTVNALAALDPATLSVVLDATGLAPGSHVVTATLSVPRGFTLVGISPGTVTVIIVPPASPTPAP